MYRMPSKKEHEALLAGCMYVLFLSYFTKHGKIWKKYEFSFGSEHHK